MLLSRMEGFRDAAARAVLESIRRDRERVSWELKPLLEYIEEHLFDPDFKVWRMKRACEVRDNSLVTRFRKELGAKPSAYVRERRLLSAEPLLCRHPELEVREVAELVGFASPQVFGRRFRKRFGASPGAYRANAAVGEPAAPAAAPAERFQPAELTRAAGGELEPARAGALIRRLQALYPEDEGPRAEEAWEELEKLRWEDQLYAVRECFLFETPALFELLSRKSLEAGRLDRQAGVRLAEVALGSVVASRAELGGDFRDLVALAWARLANARRLALDFPSAEAAFERCDVEWHKRTSENPLIEAEIYGLKAGLRAIQHRFEEALELASQAVALLSDGCSPRLLAKILIVRGSITGYTGDSATAIEDLEQALRLCEGDERLEFSAYHNLASTYAYAENYTKAEDYLGKARAIETAYDEPLTQSQLHWVEGLIKKGRGEERLAEQRLLAAREGFAELGQGALAALVNLDLACEGRPVVRELS